MSQEYEDLKAIASAKCINIFKDIAPEEVKNMPSSVQSAWGVGKELTALILEERNNFISLDEIKRTAKKT